MTSTPVGTTADGWYVCINQCARLLSVRWWCLALGGGFPEVQALRLVFKVSLSELARANGCHLPDDNDKLAKAMLGHVCFDAAMQAAARRLKSTWSICGGYALSCLTRETEPHSKYKYVKQIFSPAAGKVTEELWLAPHGNTMDGKMNDKTWYFGDVDFFLTHDVSFLPTGEATHAVWTSLMSREAMASAIKTLQGCLATVAGYDTFRPVYGTEKFTSANEVDAGYIGGVRNFDIESGLLGRRQSIQLILSIQRSGPKLSALKTVLAFDLTHCAVWIDEVALKDGDPELTLGAPCARWLEAAYERQGMLIEGRRSRAQRIKTSARSRKYRDRGFKVSWRKVTAPQPSGPSVQARFTLV